jgi:hypothetical protein
VKFLLMQFSPAPVITSLFGVNILSTPLFILN